MAKAQAEETARWADLVKDTFACEGVYKLLNTDIAAVRAICRDWLTVIADCDPASVDRREKGQDEDDQDEDEEAPARSSEVAVREIRTFCLAYTAIAKDAPMTRAEHAAATVVFWSKGGKGNKWFASLAQAARQGPGWGDIEKTAIKCASFELEHGEAYHAILREYEEKGSMDDALLAKVMKEFETWHAKLRP